MSIFTEMFCSIHKHTFLVNNRCEDCALDYVHGKMQSGKDWYRKLLDRKIAYNREQRATRVAETTE